MYEYKTFKNELLWIKFTNQIFLILHFTELHRIERYGYLYTTNNIESSTTSFTIQRIISKRLWSYIIFFMF